VPRTNTTAYLDWRESGAGRADTVACLGPVESDAPRHTVHRTDAKTCPSADAVHRSAAYIRTACWNTRGVVKQCLGVVAAEDTACSRNQSP